MMIWFAACLLISGALWAQGTTAKGSGDGIDFNRVRFGLMVAPTFSWLNVLDSDFEGEGSRLSFSYGLLLDYGFADRYAISTGIVGVPGGGNYSNDSTGTINLRMRYLQVPIYLKLRTNQFGKFTPFGQVGIAPSFALSSRYDQESANIDNENANDITKPINFSIGGGAGVEYAIGDNTSAFVSLDYQHGFLNVVDKIDDKMTNSNFAIRLGVYF